MRRTGSSPLHNLVLGSGSLDRLVVVIPLARAGTVGIVNDDADTGIIKAVVSRSVDGLVTDDDGENSIGQTIFMGGSSTINGNEDGIGTAIFFQKIDRRRRDEHVFASRALVELEDVMLTIRTSKN